MPRIKYRLVPAKLPSVVTDHLPLIDNHNTPRVHAQLHRAPDMATIHAVAVVIEADQAGRTHARRPLLKLLCLPPRILFTAVFMLS